MSRCVTLTTLHHAAHLNVIINPGKRDVIDDVTNHYHKNTNTHTNTHKSIEKLRKTGTYHVKHVYNRNS